MPKRQDDVWTARVSTRKDNWSSDTIGRKLLEGMGWSEGKGLGINQQGETEVIKLTSHRGTGVGFNPHKNEVWVPHQDAFNSLLQELTNNSGDDEEEEEKPGEQARNISKSKSDRHSVGSLENRSRSSRARIHYQKFINMKDLSGRSQHDLACILGSGAVAVVAASADNVTAEPESVTGEERKKKKKRKSEKPNEHTGESTESASADTNLQTSRWKDGGDMNTYFANKLKGLKSGLTPSPVEKESASGDESGVEIGAKSKKSKKRPADRAVVSVGDDGDDMVSCEEKKSKKKKKKEKLC